MLRIVVCTTKKAEVKLGENAVPRPAISAVWRTQASKMFSHGNARSQAIFFNELVNLVKITA